MTEKKTQELVPAQPMTPALSGITEQTVRDYLFSSGTKLTSAQQNMFLQLAVRCQLDPFKREIYAVAYGSEFSVICGYQTYIQRAEGTGLLDGWHAEEIHDDKGTLIGARVTIHRKDWKNPFIWDIALAEFDKNTANWKRMKGFMAKKVAIAQSFRLAFPEATGGLPYTAEEIETSKDAGPRPGKTLREVFDEEQQAPAPPPAEIAPPKRKSLQPAETKETTPPAAPPAAKTPAAPPADPGDATISEEQRRKLFAVMREQGWDKATLKKMLENGYGIDSTSKVTIRIYDELINTMRDAPILADEDSEGPEGEIRW